MQFLNYATDHFQNLKMGVVSKSDLKFGKNFVFNPWAPICHFFNFPTDHFQNLPKFKKYRLRKKSRKSYQFFSCHFCFEMIFNFKISLNRNFYFWVKISFDWPKSLKQLASFFIKFFPIFQKSSFLVGSENPFLKNSRFFLFKC